MKLVRVHGKVYRLKENPGRSKDELKNLLFRKDYNGMQALVVLGIGALVGYLVHG